MSDRPVTGAIWSALPVPAFLIAERNGQETILECNPAAELFMAASSAQLAGEPAYDRLSIDAPIEEAAARARANRAPIFINDADVCTGERPPVMCNLQLAPMNDDAQTLLLLIAPFPSRPLPPCPQHHALPCASRPHVCSKPAERVTGGAAAALMVNALAFDAPPPGAGLSTVTCALPALATSPAGISAVRRVALTYVVGRATPFHLTSEPLMKPVPFTVSVNAAAPARAVVGAMVVTAGAGFSTISMTKIDSAIRSRTDKSGPAAFITVADVSRPSVMAFRMMTPTMKF